MSELRTLWRSWGPVAVVVLNLFILHSSSLQIFCSRKFLSCSVEISRRLPAILHYCQVSFNKKNIQAIIPLVFCIISVKCNTPFTQWQPAAFASSVESSWSSVQHHLWFEGHFHHSCHSVHRANPVEMWAFRNQTKLVKITWLVNQQFAVTIIVTYPVTVGVPYIFALSYAEIPSLHSRREDANRRLFRSVSHPISCILSLLPPEIVLLLLDYDLQQYILGQLPEQNVLHLQFSIFC